VTRVDIKNPLGFIEPWASGSTSLSKGLRVKSGQKFSISDFDADVEHLGQVLDSQFASSAQKVKLDYATGSLEDCDPEKKTLRVVYPIFTSVVPSLNPPSIEQEGNESQRPATTGSEQLAAPKLSVTPVVGYNQTRATFGGLNFSGAEGRMQIAGRTEASSNSQSSNLSLGSHLASTKLWDNASWSAIVAYDDMPAGAARFKEGKLAGQFSASTREFTGGHVMFRYGAALEGGHQQSDDPAASVNLTPDSGYGALKLFAGVTGRPRPAAFSASYGFQLGDTFRSSFPLFKKHIVDLGFNYRFPIPFRGILGDREDFKGPLSTTVHRTIGLETRFTAGLIQDAGGTPLAERFFGGNQIRPFAQDDSWVIPSDAFIRSIPENRLGAIQDRSLGGTRFYSANVTLSYTAWGRPFIPKELALSERGKGESCEASDMKKTFPCVLNGPFHTAATALANANKARDREYMRLNAEVPAKARALKAKLGAFSNQLDTIPPSVASQTVVARQLSRVKSDVTQVRNALTLLDRGAAPDVIGLLVTNSFPKLKGDTEDLTKSLSDASQTALANEIDQTVTVLVQEAGGLQAADNLPKKKFEDDAWKKLAPGHRAIDVFLNELNVYSVSPIMIFDVARVWPAAQGVRYGIGPGLRLSLVNVNFTFGYAYNPQRLPSEKPGAIFIALDVSGLF
jgi:hypothetical protein